MITAWKGGGVFAKLKIVGECWVSARDWDMLARARCSTRACFPTKWWFQLWAHRFGSFGTAVTEFSVGIRTQPRCAKKKNQTNANAREVQTNPGADPSVDLEE